MGYKLKGRNVFFCYTLYITTYSHTFSFFLFKFKKNNKIGINNFFCYM